MLERSCSCTGCHSSGNRTKVCLKTLHIARDFSETFYQLSIGFEIKTIHLLKISNDFYVSGNTQLTTNLKLI
jgi:hypothetical protein